MKRHGFLALGAAALALTMLAGCGAGSGEEEEGAEITRTLLSGSDSGATLTTKKWRTVFMKANASYNGTGADQTCPVTLTKKSGGEETSCDPANYIELRSDGKSRSKDEGGLSETFDDQWQLTGETLSSVTNSNGGEDRVIASYALTDAGVVDGRQRIRLRTLSETEPDGTTLRPDDVGFEYVIEEIL